MKHIAFVTLCLVAGCSHGEAPVSQASPNSASGLEAAAIEAGVIPDPNGIDITGLYTRGTDRVCVVPSATAYRVGVFVDYGDQQGCAASGDATRNGETLRIDLDNANGCRFDARFDGDRIIFPADIPDGCQKFCTGRASLTALAVDRLSESASEASTLRDGKGRLLCGGQP